MSETAQQQPIPADQAQAEPDLQVVAPISDAGANQERTSEAGATTATKKQEVTLSAAELEQQQMLVNEALRAYLDATDDGDRARQQLIEQQVVGNPLIADLFRQRIAEVRRAERAAVEKYIDESLRDLAARARSFFDTIAQDRRHQYHTLTQRLLQEYSEDFRRILILGRGATTLADIGQLQQQIQAWSEKFQASVTNGKRVAENTGGPREPTEHLAQELALARALVQRIDASEDTYRKMKQQLRP